MIADRNAFNALSYFDELLKQFPSTVYASTLRGFNARLLLQSRILDSQSRNP